MSTGVVVQGLTKRFRDGALPAVADATFTAPAGQITTIVGPSGSGKTTTLRAIAGLELPDSGSIAVDGVDWTRIPVRKRRVGLVFQHYALFSHMTVRDNVAFGLKAHGASTNQIVDRVHELLELVQLKDVAERYPSQLSGGQQQRVAFARALAPNPAVLLLDEPFGALDAHVRVELRRFLRELHERTHTTTVLVTHDQEEALEISHRIVVMQSGRVVQVGTPREVYEHPTSPFVASFVGSANLLSAEVQGGQAKVGSLTVDAPKGAGEGSQVQAFIRPHDVKLRRPSEPHGASHYGVVVRLQRVGGVCRVDVRLNSGEQMSVEMMASEADAMAVKDGDVVLVDLRRATVFAGDYSI